MSFLNSLKDNYVLRLCSIKCSPFFTRERFHGPFKEHMITSFGFVFNVMEKHFYTILSSTEFQWIFNFPKSKLAIDAETRGNVVIYISLVYDFSGSKLDYSVGLRIASKSAYMTNSTLNWFFAS